MTDEGGELHTAFEGRAERAEALPAFSGFKLLHVRRQITELLAQIGRTEVFAEYTRHDITHVNKLLELAEWLVPAETQEAMTSADYLLIVLALYFHDLGMLVTRQEFEERAQSGFPAYCERVLSAGDEGIDYRAAVEGLETDAREQFLYEEFVRHNHAVRIRQWILGHQRSDYGVANTAISEIEELLRLLPPDFRQDLALVCESHHLDDLADFSKYHLSHPYGDSDAETANVQYAALILRAADLLHITADRTPPIEYRLINPTDPVSQLEWAKQQQVRRVRRKDPADLEENESGTPEPDTIEVFATFTDPEAFFGLTAYLAYARGELTRIRTWASEGQARRNSAYVFPWRDIDDANVRAEGFLPRRFAFTIDQARILDLLTGHTLYNDTGVVLREVTQNAIDAVRLRELEDDMAVRSGPTGRIAVQWDTRGRELSITDNGTGMSQEIIERHLLRVGASRYQDPEFQRAHPSFSPISRFGIGVLSAFMIADEVSILTVTPSDDEARELSLRSVHGRYLIRLIEKHDPEVATLGESGTRISMKVRASADIGDVVETMRKWIVLPRVDVSVTIDGSDPVRVGYDSMSEALDTTLFEQGIVVEDGTTGGRGNEIREFEYTVDGATVAIACEWSRYFNTWHFYTLSDAARRRRTQLGTCVEGIRVEFATPGYRDSVIAAMANATGAQAPRTNVARVGLEQDERRKLLSAVYGAFCEHVKAEMHKLVDERGFSASWAAREAKYMLGVLDQRHEVLDADDAEGSRVDDRELLLEVARGVPFIALETEAGRTFKSPAALNGDAIWIVESALFRSAESIITELGVGSSLRELLRALGVDERFPEGALVTNFSPITSLRDLVFARRSVDRVVVDRESRRVDLRWAGVGEADEGWLRVPRASQRTRLTPRNLRYSWLLAPEDLSVVGVDDTDVVQAFGLSLVMPGCWLGQFIRELLGRAESELMLPILDEVIESVVTHYPDSSLSTFERRMRRLVQESSSVPVADEERAVASLDVGALHALMLENPMRVFDTRSGHDRGND